MPEGSQWVFVLAASSCSTDFKTKQVMHWGSGKQDNFNRRRSDMQIHGEIQTLYYPYHSLIYWGSAYLDILAKKVLIIGNSRK